MEGNIRGDIVFDYMTSLSATPAPSRAAIQDSDEATSLSEKKQRRKIHGTEVLTPGDFIYPFTDARYIEQSDVLEDGFVPDQRAGPPPAHMMLHARKLAVRHLPQMDASARCDPFLVLTFDQQKTSTHVAKNVYEHAYHESFEFFVHEMQIDFAKSLQGNEGAACGIGLLIECFDWDLLSANDFVGNVTIDLIVLCSLVENAKLFTFVLSTPSGDPVVGQDGLPCEVDVELLMVPIHRSWSPPSLSKSLSLCEFRPESRDVSDSMLQRTSTIAAGYFFHKSSTSLTGSFSYKNHDLPLETGRKESQSISKFPSWTPELQLPEIEDLFADAEEKDVDYGEEPDEFYWRERLEKAMESMWVNIMVLVLVLVDLSNILIYTFYYSSDSEQPWQTAINFTVMSLFLLELTLRQIAQRMRFWTNMWNIFDFVVIWLSTGVLITKYIFEAQSGVASSLQSTKNTATSLRVFSRIAMVMRFVRVLVTVRRARMLSGAVNQKLRKAVSQNKRRYKKHGYNLDLTYITDRVIAMSAPAFGGHTAFRNDIHIVSRFLSQRHYGKFFIFNLCDTYHSSDGVMGNYHPQLLFNQVQRIPFEDHAPPLLSELVFMCQESCAWMARDRQNTIAVHCKGGKGRTGLMVSCYLIFCGIFSSPAEAMRCFEEKRTRNPAGPAQGVTGASQKRYVSLFQQALTSRVDHRVLRIRQIIVHTIPRIEGSSQFDPLMVVRAAGGAAYELSHTPRQTSCFSVRSKMTFQCGGYGSMKLQPFSCSEDVFVQEDFRIELYNGVCKSSSAEQAVFFLCLHTGMMTGESPVVFAREELDVGVWFKKQVKLLDDNVSVEVHFEEVSAQHFAAALPWQKEAGESLDKSRSRSFREWLMRKSDHESGGNRNPGDTKKENTSLQKSFVSRMIASSEAISLSDQNIPRRCIVFNEDVELAFCARCVQELNPLLVKAGDVAVQQGAFSNSLFLIWVGNFRCEVVGQGGRAVVEHVIGSNEVFGELNFLLPNVSVQADYIANQDSTVFVLDKESLRESQYTGISEQCVNHFLACVCSCKLWSRLHSTSTTSASSSARRDSALSTKSSNSFFSRDLENNSFPFSRESSELQADPALLLQSLRELPVQELVLFTWNCTCEGKLRVSGLLKVTQSYLVYEAKGFLGKSRRVRFDMLEACGSEQEGSSKVLKLLLRHLPQAEHKSHHLILRFDSTRERTECERTVKRLKTLFDEPLGRAGAGPCAQLGAFHSLPELLEGSSSFRTVRVFKQGEHVAVKKSRSSERLGWVLHGSAVETVHGKVVRRAEVGDVLFLIDFFQHFKAYQSNVTASTDCKRLAVALVSFEDIRTMLDRNPSFASRFYEYSARTMALDLYRQGSQPQSLPDVPW
uniref:Phosphatidylinositol-3,4,5-trisphosphate 3-phosphatase n=2 Tax=Hanusia phi TaxID=3032 RepID=A0A7S0F0K5_9CRYP